LQENLSSGLQIQRVADIGERDNARKLMKAIRALREHAQRQIDLGGSEAFQESHAHS
jgi:hypothetical protein